MLPSTSYVPFHAFRESNVAEVWRDSLTPEHAVDLCHFSTLAPGTHYISGRESLCFFAERYGGKGVGRNGGGSRCGTFKDFQVKGIGLNPLVGKSSNLEHRTGTATLSECLLEAMWSRICESALPYGAVKSLAVVAVGDSFQSHQDQGVGSLGRMLRQVSIRPAHFMRAIQSDLESDEIYFSDPIRTREALAQFPNIALKSLPSLRTHSKDDFYPALFQELARRFGEQLAASRVKRIPHGSLNCSNISLDGRFIDFGTMTSTLDFRPVVTTFGGPDTWNDEAGLVQCLGNLHFYCGRYINRFHSTSDFSSLRKFFESTFRGALERRFLELSGFPSSFLRELPASLKSMFWNVLYQIQLKILAQPIYFKPKEVKELPDYNINRIFKLSALCDDIAQTEESLTQQIPEPKLRSEFVNLYWTLRSRYMQHTRDYLGWAKLYLAVNCFRMNADLAFLRRFESDRLNFAIAGLETQKHLDSLVNDARFLLHEASDDAIIIKEKWLRLTPTGLDGADGCKPIDIYHLLAAASGLNERERIHIKKLCYAVH